ncbi:MAG TPA: hypothetical protein VLC79_12215 [Cellvibrio sp.]|nr:hypothetical protein [Cellvibrio sp.]
MNIKDSIFSALKKNLLPGMVLQLFAAAILIIYFFIPASKPVFSWFGLLKQEYGFAYSFIATAIFGGLIPFLYLWLSKGLSPDRNIFGLLAFYIVFWGLKGMEVDFFYRLQADWFGTGNDVKTIAIKMSVDQFLYSALWAAPGITVVYLWMESHWNIAETKKALTKEFFCVKIPTVILSNWLVWIPAVCVVYAMPSELQIPLFNLVLCFWVLLLAVLNRK